MLEMNQDNQLIHILSSYVNEAMLIIRVDDAQCLYASPIACQYFQSRASILQDKTLFELDLELTCFSQWQTYLEQVQENSEYMKLTRYSRHDGSELYVQIRAKSLIYQQSNAMLLTIRDVSSRRLYENKVVSDEALRTFTLHEAQDGFWDWNLLENSLYLSPHCFRLMCIEQDEMACSVLDKWLSVIHPDDKKAAFQTIDDHVKGKTERFKIKYRLRQEGGQYIWVQGRGATVERDDKGLPIRIIGSVIDITESESATQNLLWHAQYDALTKAYNRKKGCDFFQQYLTRAQQNLAHGMSANFQVVVFDIDDFKQVNDQYGHQTGDALLCNFSDFVKNYLEKEMVLARWGGEEFLLLGYGYTNSYMIRLVETMVKMYAATSFTTMQAKQIHTSVSAGICCLKSELDSVESMFQAADHAMYQAKASGKNALKVA